MTRRFYTYGNTTVRSAIRFPGGLKVLLNKGFSGDLDGKQQETKYSLALDKAGIIKKSATSEDQSSVARKWRSAFDKSGFITPKFHANKVNTSILQQVIDKYPALGLALRPYQITPQGRRLAQASTTYEMQDTMLRALLAIQIDSDSTAGKFKPFVFALQVMAKLREKKQKRGVNEKELVLIGNVTDHSQASDVADEIIAYRAERDKIIGKQNKSKFDSKYLSPLAKACGVKYESLATYTNPNFNYMLTTGLFSRQGKRLIFNEEQMEVIETILRTEPQFILDDVEYYYQLWNGYPLPTDNADVLIRSIKRLAFKLDRSYIEQELPTDVPDLKLFLIQLQTEDGAIHEHSYAREQSADGNIEEILQYLHFINGDHGKGETFESARGNAKFDMPTYFEWASWRAFLAIDGLVNAPDKARGFNVDQDLYPIGNAPGGRPDIVLEYKEFILVVEVTLTETSRQEAAEAEPVRRHVAEIQAKHPEKPVYGLFLAKTIDNNTAEMFRVGLWYDKDDPYFVNIVPMTLTQFIHIMQDFQEIRFDNTKVERLVEKCLIPRNATVGLWKHEIAHIVDTYQYN
ncbi:AlwI family type II restriction endonuclease [Lacticaseibacillus paracasei subsp. paracasei]|uniref:AlwI family type II restriction endonuclease n=1 Tax=Lacticaseibacillus paracasei subsp. paracasei TaxID=47714 RepID=A0AAP9KVG3_LACPA|nr:AlwI family type II restriction endonuclease [Lacticaseibacillus paracasei]QGV17955.1 AlwI family type II restriction endonuclease [Lacticaseibacillus paracasei subsp. paracasei]